MKDITLLFDEGEKELIEEKIISLLSPYLKNTLPDKAGWDINCDKEDFLLIYLADEQLKEFLPVAIENCLQIGSFRNQTRLDGLECFFRRFAAAGY